MLDYSKILFITDTDTSLGPLAAALLRHYLPLERAEISSKGLVVLFPNRFLNLRCITLCVSIWTLKRSMTGH